LQPNAPGLEQDPPLDARQLSFCYWRGWPIAQHNPPRVNGTIADAQNPLNNVGTPSLLTQQLLWWLHLLLSPPSEPSNHSFSPLSEA
jgi:hypothetical protein